MSTKKQAAPAAVHFEQSLKALEDIVQKLEAGELELEESLKLFEDGMKHSQSCKQALDQAELKVRNLLEADASASEAGE